MNESKNQIIFQARQNTGDTGRRFLEDNDTVSDEHEQQLQQFLLGDVFTVDLVF